MNDENLQHTDIAPAALPPVIDEQAGAIDLYRLALYGLVGIGVVGVLGMLIVPGVFGRDVADGVQTITALAVGALAGMIGGQAVTR
jgi:hypothetical protein